jgi:Flp pilus assembly CpaF family ATPase
MRQDFINAGGFAPLLPSRKRRRQRTALTLLTTIALAASTTIVATIVSIGRAQAEILVAGQRGDGSLAVFVVIASIIIGGMVSAVYNKHQQRPH